MRLHSLSRGTTVDVYPTGRGGAGMHEARGRSGEQPMESDRRTRAPIAGEKEPVPGMSGTGRRAHVGRTTNLLLIGMAPHLQPGNVCSVGGHGIEKQSREIATQASDDWARAWLIK